MTVRSKASSVSTSDTPVVTLGTPYNSNSTSAPQPHHVLTRPQTSRSPSSTTVGGMNIPTHHTSTPRAEQRKTRLFNPINLLGRRRSDRDDTDAASERAAQVQALQRQKNVAAVGFSKLPEDFDPRIKGKVVHDFSRPRLHYGENSRVSSYTEGLGSPREVARASGDDHRAKRRSMHTPIFKEHLGEGSDGGSHIGVQAEQLENKDFLHRASRLEDQKRALPAFARRSQMDLPPIQNLSSSSLLSEDETRRFEGTASDFHDNERDSLGSGISPITARSSAIGVAPRTMSPVSPTSPTKRYEWAVYGDSQPASDTVPVDRVASPVQPGWKMNQLAMPDCFDSSPKRPQGPGRPQGEDHAVIPTAPVRSAPVAPVPPATLLSPPSRITSPVSLAASLPSSRSTPVPEIAEAVVATRSPPRLIEKRSSAPRHNVSSASRFSFQLGDRSMEEAALEERYSLKAGSKIRATVDEDDDDFFDENAMDDMDEMELQQEHRANIASKKSLKISRAASQFLYRPIPKPPVSPMPLRNDLPVVNDSECFDGYGLDDSDEETPYWDIAAFDSYQHSRDPSISILPAQPHQHDRRQPSSGSGSLLAIDTSVANNGTRAWPYMQANDNFEPPPPLPQRESVNNENGRCVSGVQYRDYARPKSAHGLPIGDTESAEKEIPVSTRPVMVSSKSSPGLRASGLGLAGFRFDDSPLHSRPISEEQHSSQREDSETIPQKTWGVFTRSDRGSLGKVLNVPGFETDRDYNDMYDIDDMYFDDGGFDEQGYDVNGRVDEANFDDDNFLRRDRQNAYNASEVLPDKGFHPLSYSGIGDGPYPSFATPNAEKAKQRDSRLLLEDLPLLNNVDPKLIPQRNPSEDAKRLGLSKKVPPLPPVPGISADATKRIQASLQAYHAALADAANKAAADGRFRRISSTSTERSGSEFSGAGDDDTRNGLNDEADPAADTAPAPIVEDAVVLGSPATDGLSNGMSFDFGFGSAPLDDVGTNDFGDDDDDIVAAANAEALASDTDGFYGQEFGFYAKARPNSSEIEAINGGFFGADGDDGLTRNKSVIEPNLTPITERSEFSTRSSFIGLGMGTAGPHGPHTPGSRVPVSPWIDNEITTFEQLRKLRGAAFGASNGSLPRDGQGVSYSPAMSTRSSLGGGGYFGAPTAMGYSSNSSNSSGPPSAAQNHAPSQQSMFYHDSPVSATASNQPPFVMDDLKNSSVDVTPRRPVYNGERSTNTPGMVPAARKVSETAKGHSRNSSGADSVTYVKEQDPDPTRPPRWVLERRRTSELGQLELVAREFVQGGWI